MIFKKSKVLIDSIVNPVSGKSLRGHKTKRRKALKSFDFQCFLFLPKLKLMRSAEVAGEPLADTANCLFLK